MITMAQLESKTRDELEALAKEQGISGYSSLKKSELVIHILKSQAEHQGNLF
ncbi:MAG: transcription termination factor Rho, partial [Dehalococcoidia bacterium]|nr:transcription termination factor Rho [Dehalococcoidia bacterium]